MNFSEDNEEGHNARTKRRRELLIRNWFCCRGNFLCRKYTCFPFLAAERATGIYLHEVDSGNWKEISCAEGVRVSRLTHLGTYFV